MTTPAPAVRNPAALVVLLFGSTLGVMAGSTIVPVLEVIRSDLGVSGTAAGLIITAHGLAIAVSSPLVGWLIDRLGVRPVLAGGLVLYGLAGGAGLFITSYPVLIASRLVFGVGAATVFSGTTVALLGLYRGALRDRVMGWRSATTSLGGLAWPLLAGAVGGISWHAAFAVYLVGIPLGLATMVALPNSHPKPAERGPHGGMLALLRARPALLGLYALMVTTALLMYALAVFLPQRLAQVGVTEPFLVSMFTVGSSAAMSVVGLVYARTRARLGYDVLLRVSAALWVGTFVILGVTDAPAVIAVAPVLFGLGNGLAFPALTVLVGEAAPPELRGQTVALSATGSFAGQFLSPLLLGPLIGATTITTGFLAAACLAGLVLLLLLATRVPANDSSSAKV
ncbi:MFS transporter [Amycolatopsis thermalba]|uniref:MFS transporter n=1 Tax=Amycolatopsis thermalba TaxID=944492 RepID=A0ABY4NXK0_9PSEU|nr:MULTISPECIES: MFS transporter [Amycolatopsis]UQS24809.1 MFS transporter [Amycolatopsis thermalba]